MSIAGAAAKLFSSAKEKSILVIGDLMADHYVWGRSDRMSPEAPVPVVDVEKEETRAGGAANVGINLRAFGTKVSLCGLCGKDETAVELKAILHNEGFDTRWVMEEEGRLTTRKSRIIANGKHMLRLDREDRHPMSEEIRMHLLGDIGKHLAGFDAIILEDYDKGTLEPAFISAIIRMAEADRIPVIVDPKSKNFFSYGGCTVFKPNLKELNEALGLRLEAADEKAISDALQTLRTRMPHSNTLVTLGDKGMAGWDAEKGWIRIPGIPANVKDVSGAGDTVAAMLGLCLACGIPFEEAAFIANLSGAQVCESVGVVGVDGERLQKDLENR